MTDKRRRYNSEVVQLFPAFYADGCLCISAVIVTKYESALTLLITEFYERKLPLCYSVSFCEKFERTLHFADTFTIAIDVISLKLLNIHIEVCKKLIMQQ